MQTALSLPQCLAQTTTRRATAPRNGQLITLVDATGRNRRRPRRPQLTWTARAWLHAHHQARNTRLHAQREGRPVEENDKITNKGTNNENILNNRTAIGKHKNGENTRENTECLQACKTSHTTRANVHAISAGDTAPPEATDSDNENVQSERCADRGRGKGVETMNEYGV